jgi:hypothetical protein
METRQAREFGSHGNNEKCVINRNQTRNLLAVLALQLDADLN